MIVVKYNKKKNSFDVGLDNKQLEQLPQSALTVLTDSVLKELVDDINKVKNKEKPIDTVLQS